MTTQQGRDNQSSAGNHRKLRAASPKTLKLAEPCNLARCRDRGKTRNADDEFTLLWCSSKPACRRLVAPLMANDVSRPECASARPSFHTLLVNDVATRAAASAHKGIVAPRHDGTTILPIRSGKRSGRTCRRSLAKRSAGPPGALQTPARPAYRGGVHHALPVSRRRSSGNRCGRGDDAR